MKTFIVAAVAAVFAIAPAFAAPVERLAVNAPGDARIDVLAQGSGPLIVVLPSRGRGASDYDALSESLSASGYRVLRPQPRGIGASTGPTKDLTLHDLARDIAAVIEQAKDGPAIVVGHAFGNFVVRTLAADQPALVRGVVVAAAAGKSYPEELARAVSRSSDMSRPDAERLKDLQATFFAPGHDPSVWLGGWYTDVDHYQRSATLSTQQSDWWAAGTAPLLEIQADQDPFMVPAQRGELKQTFGDRVTVVLIKDAGHALVPEQPEAVAKAIVDWAATLGPQGATKGQVR